MAERRVVVGTGAWGAADGDLLIQLGAGHPAGSGMLKLRLRRDGARLTAAEAVIGFVHRGAENLFQARDYRQIIVLANRHDWLSAFSSELWVGHEAESRAANLLLNRAPRAGAIP